MDHMNLSVFFVTGRPDRFSLLFHEVGKRMLLASLSASRTLRDGVRLSHCGLH